MIRRALALVAMALAAVTVVQLATASPAAAHGVGGTTPSNYDTRLLAVNPEVDGISVAVIDLGDRLQVINDTETEILILGYEDEPYLRVGPDGVFENQQSPATWANKDRYATEATPPDVDPEAEPVWEQISDDSTAQFHWHLAHWMSPARPGIVDDDPGSEHLLGEWALQMVPDSGDSTIVASGDLRWIPGPSPVLPIVFAILLAVAVVLGSLTKYWRWVIAAGLAVLVGAEVVHFVGLWSGSTDSTIQRLLENLYSIAGIGLAIPALWRLVNPARDPYDGTPLALIAGLVLAVAGGLADLSTLTSSQLPSALTPTVARGLLVVTLGVGFGVVIASALKLRRPVSPVAPAQA